MRQVVFEILCGHIRSDVDLSRVWLSTILNGISEDAGGNRSIAVRDLVVGNLNRANMFLHAIRVETLKEGADRPT